MMIVIAEQRAVDDITQEQYCAHLFCACLRFNLSLQLEVFYLCVDNVFHRNLNFLFPGMSE